jgi:hypothetical protein
MQDSGVSDACVFVAIALMVVWMQRQKVPNVSGTPTRWGAFFGALSGKYTLQSTTTGSSASSSSSSSGGASGVGQPLAGTSSSGTGTNKITVVS